MMNATAVAGSGTQSGIHAIDRPVPVMLLRSGSTFDLACSECRQTIARNLRDAEEIGSRTELIAAHKLECAGPRRWWMRRVIRLFAVS